MFELTNISKSFKDGEKNKVIFKDCSFTFPDKGMIFIVGKSGCGKSTLLNLLAGFDTPDEGKISFLGKNVNGLNEQESVSFYQHEIGFVFQEFNLIESLNVFENIAISSNGKINDIKLNVSNALKKVDLSGYGQRKISQLSGGQKQRVAIARALCSNVKVLLCDEPTGSLDKNNSNQVFDCLKEISQTSLVIIVSHDLQSAQKYGDDIITIKDGSLVSNKENVKEQNKNICTFNSLNYKRNINVGKLGLSYTLSKKVRILIAILLMTISLSAFGISSSLLTFTKTDAVLNHMEENDLNYLSYKKVLDYKIDDHSFSQKINLSKNDILNIQNYTGINVLPKYSYFNQKIVNIYQKNSDLYSNVINGFCEINTKNIEELGFNIYGNLPSNDNEIVITDYTYQMFKWNGYKSPSYEITEISTYDDIIGREMQLSAYQNFVEYDIFKIVGILDTSFNKDIFGDIDSEEFNMNDDLDDQLEAYFNTSLDQTIFLKEGYYERNIVPYNDTNYSENKGININNSFIDCSQNFNKISYVIPSFTNVIYKNSSLDDNGVILPLESFETTENICLASYVGFYAESIFDEIEEQFKIDYGEESTYITYVSYLSINGYKDTKYHEISKDELTRWCVNKFIEEHGIFEQNTYSVAMNANISNTLSNLEIQGITFGDNEQTVYLSMNNYDGLVEGLSYYKNDISSFYIPLNKKELVNKKLFSLEGAELNEQPEYILDTNYKVNKVYVKVDNLSTFIYDSIDNGISFYKTIILAVGCSLFIFSICFMIFDIKGIVSFKEKEIGILKSLGVDIKSIISAFMIYTTIFTLLTSILSNITCVVTNNIINNLINKTFHCIFTFINYSYIQAIFGLLITFISCSVISIFSVMKTYRRKTIDLLR